MQVRTFTAYSTPALEWDAVTMMYRARRTNLRTNRRTNHSYLTRLYSGPTSRSICRSRTVSRRSCSGSCALAIRNASLTKCMILSHSLRLIGFTICCPVLPYCFSSLLHRLGLWTISTFGGLPLFSRSGIHLGPEGIANKSEPSGGGSVHSSTIREHAIAYDHWIQIEVAARPEHINQRHTVDPIVSSTLCPRWVNAADDRCYPSH